MEAISNTHSGTVKTRMTAGEAWALVWELLINKECPDCPTVRQLLHALQEAGIDHRIRPPAGMTAPADVTINSERVKNQVHAMLGRVDDTSIIIFTDHKYEVTAQGPGIHVHFTSLLDAIEFRKGDIGDPCLCFNNGVELWVWGDVETFEIKEVQDES